MKPKWTITKLAGGGWRQERFWRRGRVYFIERDRTGHLLRWGVCVAAPGGSTTNQEDHGDG